MVDAFREVAWILSGSWCFVSSPPPARRGRGRSTNPTKWVSRGYHGFLGTPPPRPFCYMYRVWPTPPRRRRGVNTLEFVRYFCYIP